MLKLKLILTIIALTTWLYVLVMSAIRLINKHIDKEFKLKHDR
jgi:hypothetical protein